MRLKHPISRTDYTRNDDGTVTVAGRDDTLGIFDRNGRWISGDVRFADPLLCMFVSDGFTAPPGGDHAVLKAGMDAEGVEG